MLLRALLLLAAVIAFSLAASAIFGERVLVALGVILLQAKLLATKLWQIRMTDIVGWLKAHGLTFFRKDLAMKWLSTYGIPLILGKTFFRRIAAWIGRYRESIAARYGAMMDWYSRLSPLERAISALIILIATLGLSVSSLGLWLILFSVKLPLWLVATFATLLRSTWLSIQKTVFKTIAFLQLGWVWKLLRARLPHGWLARKRRLDYRIARAVVRRRRLTVMQLAERKDRLPFRTGVLLEWLFLPHGSGDGK